MSNWVKVLNVIVVVETLLIGIYCCGKLNVDCNGPEILISALGVLVTFLVAWQIWQTMASREEIRKAMKTADDLIVLKSEMENSFNSAMASITRTREIIKAETLKQMADNETIRTAGYRIYLDAILHYLKAREEIINDGFQDCLANIESILDNADNFTDFDKEIFIREKHLHNDLYHEILQNVNQEIDHLNTFRNHITEIHDKRIALFNKLTIR